MARHSGRLVLLTIDGVDITGTVACWAAEQKGSEMTRDLRLMAAAAEEITSLRHQVDELARYHRHTERMLALSEARPRAEGCMVGEGEDVAWALRQRIADAKDTKLEVPAEDPAEDPS